MLEKIKNLEASTIVKYVVMLLAAVFIIALFVFNLTESKEKTSVHFSAGPWNEAMVMGSSDAPNKMVQYTDYFCSFCAQVHEAMGEEFKEKYIDSGVLSFEARVVDLLKELSVNTPKGNQAAFCAADQDKYWEYSDEIIAKIDEDYFSKGIGVKNVANPVKIPKLEDEYFLEPAIAVEMDEVEFSSCINNNIHQEVISRNSEMAIGLGVTGLPGIVVNNYTASGFGGGGFAELELVLEAGGVSFPD